MTLDLPGVLIPREYIEMILSSKPVKRVCPLPTIFGSKLPLRSRGVSREISPKSPFSFGTREELTSPARRNFTTNRPRLRCLSDEHGLVALGLAARSNAVHEPIQRYTRLRHG